MRVWFRQWRQESWVAAIITTGSILVVVLNAVVGILDKKTQVIEFLGWNKCYVFDPKTEKPNTKLERPCLPGKITFIKWTYPFDSEGKPVDGCPPNRVFQVRNINGGQIEWEEQYLKGNGLGKCGNIDAGSQSKPKDFFIAINGGQLVPTSEMVSDPSRQFYNSNTSGFILRKINIVNRDCSSTSNDKKNVQSVEVFIEDAKHESGSKFLEFFKPNASRCIPPSPEQHVWIRMSVSSCGDNVGTGFVVGGAFNAPFGLRCAMRDAQGLGM